MHNFLRLPTKLKVTLMALSLALIGCGVVSMSLIR